MFKSDLLASCLKLAVTGHRPDKVKIGNKNAYNEEVYKKLIQFAINILQNLKPIEVIYTGMALGWDQAIASAAHFLKIPYIACVPFKGQEGRWPEKSQKDYRELLKLANRIEITSEGSYAAYKMQVRNEYMVDNCEMLLALYDGSKGGTGNCVEYARKKGVDVYNVWDKWIEFIN